MVVCKTKSELARVLGVTPQTVNAWAHKGMPTLTDGTFDSETIGAWDRERKARMAIGGRPKSGGGADPDYWLAEQRRHQAAKLELQVRRIRSELVERQWMDEQFAARGLEMRRALQGLARSLPPELVLGLPADLATRTAKAIQARLEDEFRQLCNHYARSLPEAPIPGQEASEDEVEEDEEG